MAILLILLAFYILGNVIELFEFGKFWKSGDYVADRKPPSLDHFDKKTNADGGESNE